MRKHRATLNQELFHLYECGVSSYSKLKDFVGLGSFAKHSCFPGREYGISHRLC